MDDTLLINKVCSQLLEISHDKTLKLEQIYEVLSDFDNEEDENLLLDIIKFLEINNISIEEDEEEIDFVSILSCAEINSKKQDAIEDTFFESGDYDYRNFGIDDLSDEIKETTFYKSSYLASIACYNILSIYEEQELGEIILDARNAKRKLEQDPDDLKLQRIVEEGELAKEKLINHNLRLVVKIASKYNNKDLDFMDLVQEGNIGLIYAVEHYDYRLGYKFSTYAYHWIRQSISKYVKTNNLINIPLYALNEQSYLKNKQSDLYQKYGTENISSEILSKELDGKYNEKKVKEYLNINASTISLDAQMGNDGEHTDLYNIIESKNSYQNEMDFEYPTGWEKLSEKEQDIFLMFYKDHYKLDDIAKKYNVSSGRIRQIKDKAKRKLEYYSKQTQK